MAKIIDGKKISAEIKEELKTEVAAYAAQGKKCALAVIQVGADPASSVYVRNKKKACAYIGIESLSYELPEETTEEELLALIQKLNDNPDVHGILCQLPLPKHICEDHVIQAIDPQKDVDGFPTMLLLPITTQCFPAISILLRFNSWIIPAGVQETNPFFPTTSAPTFCG